MDVVNTTILIVVISSYIVLFWNIGTALVEIIIYPDNKPDFYSRLLINLWNF